MATRAPEKVTRADRARSLHGIYVILNDDPQMLELAQAVLDAGVRIVQYRAKRGIVTKHVLALRDLTRRNDALLIVNDDWRATETFDCDGVHLGPGDDGFTRVAPVRAAMRDRLIGLSCGTIDEAHAAETGDVDYVGTGSIYATTSKSDAGAPIGTAGLRAIAAATKLPVAAVGGITARTISDVRHSGAAMAAVISAISGSAHPRQAAAELLDAWNRCDGAGTGS
ncbi:MAG: thiamine phosphate synthase [Candidatus Cybelea sp.]